MRLVNQKRARLCWVATLIVMAAVVPRASAQRKRAREPRPEGTASAPASRPTTSSAPASAPTTTAPKLVPLSFNNAPLGEIAKFLTEQFGKPIIIGESVKSKNVTVTNPKPLPVADAMDVLTTALHDAGIAIDERERTVHLIAITDVIQAQLKTLGPDVDLKTVSPGNLIVRKMFLVRYYDATRLVDVIRPLLPAWSQITADSSSGKLMIVSEIERLRLVAGIITQLDAPDVSGGELRVFPIRNVEVAEIIPTLERLVSGYLGVEVKAFTTGGGAPGKGGSDRDRDRMQRMMMEQGMMPGNQPMPSPSPGGAVSVKPEKTPVLLIPEPRRSSLVVVAPTNVLLQIESWLKYLDQAQPAKELTESVEVKYGDAGELASQLQNMLSSLPDETLRSTVRIFPFAASRRIMIAGPEASRKIVKGWLAQFDVADSGLRETQTFTLKNADAQQIVDNIKELFQDGQSRYFYYYGDRSRGEDRSKVQITANTRNNSVTVVASAEKMVRIAEQIRDWDQPLKGEEAAPRIYNLKYADPDKTKTLLESLFTKKEATGGRPWWYDDMEQPTAASPVGRLFGQFRFEAYPDTGKLIVVSKNEENYTVIDRMIAEIDSPQSGGLPRVIQLKFADAETLAEQLNALLNAPGTPASILRHGQTGTFKELSDKGSPYSRNGDQGTNQNRNPQQNQPQGRGNSGEMQFWWQNPPSDLVKNRQPSNLVGKLRIVPNVEQNLLLVVAPKEFADDIEQFVTKLDRPGQQVLIKALIAEITHDDETSLGYRFSSDPTAFGVGADSNLTDNNLKGLLTYNFQDFFGHQNQVTFNMDINNLLSLLRRVTSLKIRSEPKVFTADNVEAEFFDGQDIPFITDSQVNSLATQTQSFDYREVGIRLRVRPHITEQRKIDLTVNLLVSNIGAQRIFGFAVVDRRETTTRIVLEDGHSFMISGILREEDKKIEQGIPGLQDIPGIGEVFKHHGVTKVNSEVLIFLTPYVINAQDPHYKIEAEPLNRLQDKMDVSEQFGPIGDPDEGYVPASRPSAGD